MVRTTTHSSPETDEQGRSDAPTSDPQPAQSGTDWARLEAMTDEENRANAASDLDAVVLTARQRRRLRPVPDPRAIRQQLGLTQEEFSDRFEIPLGTLRDWEQGRRFIDGTARVLLRTIALAPEVVDLANHPEDQKDRPAAQPIAPAPFQDSLKHG